LFGILPLKARNDYLLKARWEMSPWLRVCF